MQWEQKPFMGSNRTSQPAMICRANNLKKKKKKKLRKEERKTPPFEISRNYDIDPYDYFEYFRYNII